MAPGRRARRPVRLLRPRPARLPHLPGAAARSRPGRRRAGERPLHRRGREPRPAGLPQQRPDGVRVGLRPRRLPRARLHRRLPAPLLRSRARLLRRRVLGRGRAADDRGPAHEPLRREDGDAHLQRRRRQPPSASSSPTTADFFSDPKSEHGLRPDAITDPTELQAADRLLRLDGLGGGGRAARPRLLVHEQLAVRAARRQQADGERDRLVGALADRAPRRHRPPLRRLRPLGAKPRLARTRAGDALLPNARRRRPDAGAAGDRLVLLRHGGALPAADARRRGLAALPGRDRQLLRLRPRAGLPLQPDAHLARAAGDLLGRDLLRRRRHLPGADDRPPRAQGSGASSPSPSSARSQSSSSAR